MKKQKINSYEYTISQEEMGAFLRALQYCKHRIIEHSPSGAESVGSLEYLRQLINEIRKVL